MDSFLLSIGMTEAPVDTFIEACEKTLQAEDSVELHQDSWPLNTEKIDIVDSATSFGIICYAALNN